MYQKLQFRKFDKYEHRLLESCQIGQKKVQN